jgi:redox-sensitive bicupin YhaK (pirin superfamily)
MPAVTADTLTLPRLNRPTSAGPRARPVARIVTAHSQLEGEGFVVRRPFPSVDLSFADPFVLLDHMGAVEYGPGEAKGAPWHPHRGFETVTYMIDGAFEHQDSTGGGGLITDGGTQWMTAGAGILHSEMPPDQLVVRGGLFHGVQLWVNLPAELKWTPPRYQDIEATDVALLSSLDGGALVRVIAGELGGHAGPGATRTPITYLHATVSPGAELAVDWPRDFNALVYVLAGRGSVGPEVRPLEEGQLAVLGPGESIVVRAAGRQPAPAAGGWEIIVLGGLPIREPIARYGPFVMTTREEIVQAVEDYHAGRMGIIPATHMPHRTSADETTATGAGGVRRS